MDRARTWNATVHFTPSSGDREATDLDNIAQCNNYEDDPELESLHNISAGELEEILLLDLLEDTALDLYKLVRHEQAEQRVGIRVHGDIQSDDLVEQAHGVDDVVHQRHDKHAEWKQDLGTAQTIARQSLGTEEAFQDILTNSCQKSVTNLE